MHNVGLGGATSGQNLLFIELHIGELEFAHLFDLVEINDEALLQVVQVFDALATKD